MARITAMPAATPNDRLLRFEDLTVNLDAYRVQRGGVNVHLGPTEYRLLCYLLRNPGRVHSRRALIDAAWPSGANVRLSSVDMYILRLRRALAIRGTVDLIQTIHATGYALRPPEAAD